MASEPTDLIRERFEYAVMVRAARPNMDGSTAYVRVVDHSFGNLAHARNAADRHPNPNVVVCKRRVTKWEEVDRG